MKVIIPGGSGQLGHILARALSADGHDVVVLSRHLEPAMSGARRVHWDGRTLGPWADELRHAQVVINLAGRTVDCRPTPRNRQQMMNSRVDSTQIIGQAIADLGAHAPHTWLQMSTATIYAHRYDAPNDEHTGLMGGAEPDAPAWWASSVWVARAWERALAEATTPHTRKVALRTAMVMSPDAGGVFDVLSRLTRWGLGGAIAGGRQYVSWIHARDFARAVIWLIEHREITGAVNLAAPEPLPQRRFMGALRAAWGVRLGLPAAGWMVALGAWLLRTDTELLRKSRRVVPGRLLAEGFEFDHPTWAEAATGLVARAPQPQPGSREASEPPKSAAKQRPTAALVLTPAGTRARRVARHTGLHPHHIHPRAVPTLEARALVDHARLARVFQPRHKRHRALDVFGPAAGGGIHRQPEPGHRGPPRTELGGARRSDLGLHQPGAVAHSERHIARSHQRLSGLRRLGTPQNRRTTGGRRPT